MANKKDNLDILIYLRDGVNWIRVSGKKNGRKFVAERPYGGKIDSPTSIAKYILDAEFPSLVNDQLSGQYDIEWHTTEIIEEGVAYQVPVLDDLRFTPLA